MATVSVGAARLTRIEESYAPCFAPSELLPDWRDAAVRPHMDLLMPHHLDPASGKLLLSVHSWLIEVGGRRVLIDTCVGNHKSRPLRPQWSMMRTRYLARLRRAGVRPDAVDLVMCTHLHQDHVGWNTRLVDGRWRPTFPNARYVFSRADLEASMAADAVPGAGPVNHGAHRDSVVPVLEEGLADIVDAPTAIDEHLRVDPAPGHTAGHMAVTLASRGGSAVFCGDALHHVVQLFYPGWNSFVCADPAAAARTRRALLERCAGSGAVLAPTHFGAPFLCRVEPAGAAFRPVF